MYLYCPVAGYRKALVRTYERFLKRLVNARATVYISSLVLSEFFNAYLRIEFNIRKRKNPSKYTDFKKDFRGTVEYRSLMSSIKTIVRRQILRLAKRLDDEFGNINLDELFVEIEKFDFNDAYYAALVARQNFSIVTNDRDFAFTKSNVKILTANQYLLRRNP